MAGIPKPVIPAPRQFVFTADRGTRGAPGARPPLRRPPVIQEVEDEEEDEDEKEDEKEKAEKAEKTEADAEKAETVTEKTETEGEGEGEAPAPPPPLFQADAILKGNGMSLFRDRRLYRKYVALRSAWWADDADLADNPVVPLLPDGTGGLLDAPDTGAAPVPLI